MLVELQRLDHEGLELPGQQIGQVEGGELVVRIRQEFLVAGEEGIAMRPADPLDAFLGADLVELPLRAAFGIADEDARISFPPRLADRLAHRGADLLGIDVPDRRQADEVDVLQPVRPADRDDLARDGAAGDHPHAVGQGHGGGDLASLGYHVGASIALALSAIGLSLIEIKSANLPESDGTDYPLIRSYARSSSH